MKNSNEMINPQALKAFRKKSHMTQQQLADAIRAKSKGCTKDTVSRWERGKSRHVRKHLRNGLCDVLRVEWEQLTEPPGQPEYTAGEVRIAVGRRVKNALQLVAKRYDIHAQDVVNLAPLMFLIIAELSLRERKRQLDKVYKEIDEANEKLNGLCTHLHGMTARIVVEEHAEEEENSLNNRDVFGRKINYQYRDEDMVGPFVQFVEDLVKILPKDAVGDIDSFFGDRIDSYRIADDTLQDSTGIVRDNEPSESLLHYIHYGRIDYSKCLRVRRDKDELKYRQWLSDELARCEGEDRQAAENLDLMDDWR